MSMLIDSYRFLAVEEGITFPITASVAATYNRTVSFTLPEAPLENDIIVLSVGSPNYSASFSVPGDWTLVGDASFSGMESQMLYHRVTAAEAGASTVTWTLTNFYGSLVYWTAQVAVLRGVALTGELVGAADLYSTSSVDGTVPSVTPTADCTVIASFIQDSSNGRTSAPTGYSDLVGNNDYLHNYLYYRTANGESGVATGNAAANTSNNGTFGSVVGCFLSAADAPPYVSVVSDASGYGSYGMSTFATISVSGVTPIENDIVVLFIDCNTSAAMNPVSGWTQVDFTSLGDGSMSAGMLYHRVTAAEAAANTVSWTLTDLFAAGEVGAYSTCVLRGVATTGELVGSAISSNTNAVDGTVPTMTPTDACAVIAGFSQDGGGGRTSTPTGYDTLSGASGSFVHNHLYRRTADGESGVATGNAAANTSTNDEYVSIVAGFKGA